MDYGHLIESAREIPAAGKNTISEYQSKAELLIATINMNMSGRYDITELIGKNNMSLMKDNHFNHVLFISSILKIPNHEVLVNTVLWVFKTYRNRGFSVDYWNIQTNAWFGILKTQMSPEAYAEIEPLYIWIKNHIPAFEKLSSDNEKEENDFQ